MNKRTRIGSAERGLGASLRMAHRLYSQRLQAHLAERDLTSAQYLHLRALFEDGPLYQNEISALLGIEKASSTGVLDWLDRTGMIERRRDAADRRRMSVQLSDEGRRLTAGILSFAQKIAQNAIANVDESDRDVFFRVMDRIVANLSEQSTDDRTD